MAAHFKPSSPADVARLIADYPLAWIISRDFQATPLPLMTETDANGAIVSLVGHFARRNPQVAALQADPHALILFQGPQAYISPRFVSKPAWGPTWNYAVARFEVTVEFVPDEIDDLIRRLAHHVERARLASDELEPPAPPDERTAFSLSREPWTVEDMGPRYAQLRSYIIGFRAQVLSAHATFKLGQDEDARTFAEITAALGDTPLAQWMSAQRASEREHE